LFFPMTLPTSRQPEATTIGQHADGRNHSRA
jgi:hypothetical protein